VLLRLSLRVASASQALAVALALGVVAGCASPASRPTARPPAPPSGLTPTACERNALLTGQPPDVSSPAAAAENLRWGELAPESCPDVGRLDDRPPGFRR
jgi:hypothetical protein